ncbi:alpha/beta hydrolase fold domain-containing protein [Maribacter sp. PR1]|jgi:acetyl esterase/lipase|uniref:Alpha/beta hydrolase fold domain-containing protein n=1 Tax=Maribacter cobaltidurans TaxID=1178778 RepID=A0ABU7IZV7_9FLAO|nr:MULTISPECIES: alpha/beta hydrolase fold domain-containing protein [Maribacter]MDC6390654.1 alpha/beta hydrolase fold domain-containing protein [Maribacter sp. PR1]MEE1978046.1 alpha/beta hydrolase fold domain-containing protein [Maribacter cobaltidurans]
MKKFLYIPYAILMVPAVLVFALMLFGTFANWPMYLGGYTGLLQSHYSAQILVVIFVFLGLAFLVFRKKSAKLTKYLFYGTGVLFVAQVFVIATLYRTAFKHQLPLSFTQALSTNFGVQGPHETFSYLELDGKKYLLDVYRPFEGVKRSIPVIQVHGGGYVAGSRTDDRHHEWFTKKGFTVFDVDYPLATDDMHTWETAANAIATAVSYVVENAQKFNVDTSKLILYGGSAGGGLVIQAGYGLVNGNITPYSQIEPVSPKAIIAIFPPVDFTGMWKMAGQGVLDMRSNAIQFVGGSPDEFPERYKRLDIVNSLHKGLPETLIITGSRDHVVPIEGARKLLRKAERLQVPISYQEVPFGEHSFEANANSLSGQIKWQAMEKFLTKNKLMDSH